MEGRDITKRTHRVKYAKGRAGKGREEKRREDRREEKKREEKSYLFHAVAILAQHVCLC